MLTAPATTTAAPRPVASGLHPTDLAEPYDTSIDLFTDLLRSAGPVIDQLASDLSGTGMTVLLGDADVRIVKRLDVASASAPISDPRTGHTLGAVTIVCDGGALNPLMMPVVRQAAREIEQRLLDGASSQVRLLDEQFLRARRGVRSPLVVVGHRTLLMNAAASRLVHRSDHEGLWQFAAGAIGTGEDDSIVARYSTSAGISLNVTIEAIRDAGGVVGALLRLRPVVDDTAVKMPAKARRGHNRPQYGWASLTDHEQRLAELVAEGLTNKEAAARLFVSHHTVDSHLRHIFRKLDINSRVALARVVTATQDDVRTAA
jgi:DNA-binding CsgD family transcriptional regulator